MEKYPASETDSPVSSTTFEKRHDAALDFIQANRGSVDADLHLDPAYCRRMRRKIDLIMMPFLFLCYVMNTFDKTLINFANVMGLTPGLKLQGNDFSNAGSAFFIAIVICSIPNAYLLQRLPVAKYLAFNVFMWGICTACHCALHNSTGLIVLRVFCGIFESAVPSALMLLTSQWYNRSEQSLRFVYWFCGLGVGQIIGSFLSWAFQHVPTPPTELTAGWRMMFLALGCFTILVGVATFFFVPDTVMEARFFTVEERINVLEHVRVNQTGIQNIHFQPKQLIEALLDFQTWTMFMVSIMIGIAGTVLAVYSATLLASFGFSNQVAALLNMPSGAVNIISMLFVGLMSRRYGRRFVWTSLTTAIAAAGAALLAFLSSKNQGGSLAGLYLINIVPAGYPVINQWALANVAGHTKRTYMATGMNAAFALGNLIGPQTFQAKDKPEYQPAKLTAFASQIVSFILILTLAFYYKSCNRKRDARSRAVSAEELSETKAYAGLTDKQNSDFRYVV